MKQIVCLSNEAWSHSPGRTQQLITRLKHTQVLFFSPSGSWREIRFRAKGRAVKPNITVYPLPPLLLPADERYGPLFRLEQLRLARFIAGRMEEHRFRSPLLWCACPEQVHLLDRLDYDGLIYDCDREWDDLPPAWEGSLASAADVVFAASPELAERLSPCSGNIALLPNGVTYPLFSRIAAPSRPRPEDPVLGWAGTIHGNLDLSPLLYAAQARPRWTFLLLGRREQNPLLHRLARLPNVHFLPPCPLMEVPEHLSRCRVLLNFLREDQPDCDVIPTRIYEYLSTGRPIVSMLWPARWSTSQTWYTGPTPIRSSSPCASTPWRSPPPGSPSAVCPTGRRRPGPSVPDRSPGSWAPPVCCEVILSRPHKFLALSPASHCTSLRI